MLIRGSVPLALVVVLSASQVPFASAQKPMPPQSTESAQAQSRTVYDMRNVGTALFNWLEDRVNDESSEGSSDPKVDTACVSAKDDVSACDVVDINGLPVISHQELTRLLVPVYISAIPERDGWGNLYEFRVDRKNIYNRSVMAIRSPGQDGTFSGNRYELGSFLPVESDQDLVWMDGFFIRRPQREDVKEPQ